MSPLLYNNFPKLVIQFVLLYLRIAKLYHNQLMQTKMVILDKLLRPNSK